jgi:ABC-type transporter Mla MlaB component
MEIELDFTGMLATAQRPAVELGALDYLPTDIQDNELDALPSRYHSASLESVEMGVRNEALQDAAARFAEGDSEGAETALIGALQSPDSDNDTAEACSAALLDLYRATGQQDSFEVVAIEYAQLFGRSAPEWQSLAELTQSGEMGDGSEQTAQPTLETQSHWVCPSELEIWDLATLQSVAGQAASLHLRWNELRLISAGAAQPLLDLFQQWAQRTMELHVSGEETLLGVLTALTPLSAPDTDEVWWNLKLELLRLLGRHEAFEEAALDYCVTYEISPPSWVPTRCTLVGEDTPEVPTQPADLEPSGPSSRLQQEAATLALVGVLVGDVTQTLEQLRRGLPIGSDMVISCARLVRVDFTAAASILNWVMAYQSQGGVVQFINVPGLLAAYFEIMGISLQASVRLKRA